MVLKKLIVNSLKPELLRKAKFDALIAELRDMLKDPEQQLTRLLTWMEFDYEAGMLNFHQDRLTQENAGVQPAWENLSQGILSKNKHKYRSALRDKEVKAIEKICYHEMRIAGYEPEYSPRSLAKVQEEQIESLRREETQYIERSIPEAVKQNMEAKKVFYRKEIDNA